jgi:hypothetical protein
MAIGRVPGAALLSNLDRQGLDLSFTTSSQTLAYLDFANFRLGINTLTPQEALDITGNVLVTNGNVLTSANLSYNIGTTSTWWRNIYVGNISSTNITGTLTTASQTNITTVGTLGALTVTGNINAGNVISNITGNVSGSAATVTASSQPAITSLGNLISLSANGTIQTTGVIYGNSGLSGTVLTNAQPNITSVGTLSALAVTGNVSGANIIGTSLYGTLISAAQTNVTSLGTLSELTVSGNIIAQSSVVPTSNIAGNIGYANKWWNAVYANTVNATNLNGTILTAIQPNITNLGNITVDSISVGGNVVIGGNINGATITANAFIQNGHAVLDTITTINVTGDVTGSGNISNIALTLPNTGVIAGIYGSADDEVADRVPKITVDSKGRITNIANVTLTQVGNVTFTDTTISTTSSLTLNSANNGNIILNANGTGTVQIVGNDAVGIPYGNIATRPTNVHTGYLRYNTDLVAIEYYNGSGWQNDLNINGTLSSETIYPTGATNSYTLLESATTDGVLVSINGTLQQPTTAYTVSGNVITFTETPLSSDVIEVRAITMNLVSVPAISDGNTRIETNATSGEIAILNYGTNYLKINQAGTIVGLNPNTSIASSAVATTIDTYDNTLYRTAKYVVQATRTTNMESYEVLVTHNGTTAYSTTYGIINSGTALGTISATISGSNVLVQYTATGTNTNIRISKNYLII